MKRTVLISLLCLSCLLLPALARRPQRSIPAPDWVSNPGLYNQENQLVLSGAVENSREAAEASAKSSLIASFRGTVPPDLDYRINRSHALLNNLVYKPENQERISSLRLRSEDNLHGIHFSRYWTEAPRRIHALAQMNRNAACLRYQEQIHQIESRVMALLYRAVHTDDAWERYSLFNSAASLDAHLGQLCQELAIIDPATRANLRLDYDSEVLNTQLREYSRQVRMKIVCESDSLSEGIAPPLQVMASLGFTNDSGSDLVFLYNITREDTDSRRKSEFIYSYSFNLSGPGHENLINFLGSMRFSLPKGSLPGETEILSLRQDIENNLRRLLCESCDTLSLRP